MMTNRSQLTTFQSIYTKLLELNVSAQILTFFIWKRSSLIECLENLECLNSSFAFYEWIFKNSLLENAKFEMYKSLQPLIAIYPYVNPEQLYFSCQSVLIQNYEEVSRYIDDVEGWLVPGQERYLFEKVKQLPDHSKIIEVGACYGRSTCSMAFACVGSNKQIFSIDTFLGNTKGGTRKYGNTFFDIWANNIKRYNLHNYVNPAIGFSHEVLKKMNIKFSFAFINASHHYIDVLKEFELIYPLIEDGGWIAFHDVAPDWPGPWRVWRETAMQLLSSHEYISTLACGQKVQGKPFDKPLDHKPFNYAQEWATYLNDFSPQTSKAMLMFGFPNNKLNKLLDNKIEEVEAIIASMPTHYKNSLREMLKLEAASDPILHYWSALTYLQENNFKEAHKAFSESSNRFKRSDFFYRRINYHKQKIGRITNSKNTGSNFESNLTNQIEKKTTSTSARKNENILFRQKEMSISKKRQLQNDSCSIL